MRLLLPLLVLLLLAGCGGSSKQSTDERSSLPVFVNAPFSRTPYLGRAIENGARLAAREVNANGIRVGGTTYNLKIETLDSGLSPARAVSNVRRAVGRHAVAIVDEGTGIDASWRIAAKSGVPIGVVFEGGNQVIDPVARPNVFRVAPTDHGIAFRLAEYLIPKGLHIALFHDDSEYGAAGEDALRSAFSRNQSSIAGDYSVPADALDVAPQVLRARRAHATALLVWGRPATIAATITAARTAGWNVPVYTSPDGRRPVRPPAARRPSGLGRRPDVRGRAPDRRGRHRAVPDLRAEARERVRRRPRRREDEGRRRRDPAAGDGDVRVRLRQPGRRGVLHAGSTDPAQITKALNEVTVQGANGDQRGFNLHNHEGVVDDDVYFARFHDMTYAPVQDDPLSKTLPTVSQIR